MVIGSCPGTTSLWDAPVAPAPAVGLGVLPAPGTSRDQTFQPGLHTRAACATDPLTRPPGHSGVTYLVLHIFFFFLGVLLESISKLQKEKKKLKLDGEKNLRHA